MEALLWFYSVRFSAHLCDFFALLVHSNENFLQDWCALPRPVAYFTVWPSRAYMGGGCFPKLVWPKHNMVNQQVKVGVVNNDKRAKCATGKVGVATVTPAIRHSPPMRAYSTYTMKILFNISK